METENVLHPLAGGVKRGVAPKRLLFLNLNPTEEEEEEEEEDLFVFNDTIEGPRAPAVTRRSINLPIQVQGHVSALCRH